MPRSLPTALAAVALLAAAPAAAQGAQELLGRYPLTATYEGTGCPDEQNVPFEVTAIRGGTLDFEIDGDRGDADYHGPSKSFRKQMGAADDTSLMTGRFTRRPDSIRLDIEWRQGGCTARLAGIRPAAPLPVESMPAPPSTAPAAATTAAEPGAPATAARPDVVSQIVLYAPFGLLLVAVGGLVGWLAARRRKKPDPGD